MKTINYTLALGAALALSACGNSSSDAPKPITPPPESGNVPNTENFDNTARINLALLEGKTGQALVDGLEAQLNETLLRSNATKSLLAATDKSHFTITPNWGFGLKGEANNLSVVNVNGIYTLQTTLEAGATAPATSAIDPLNGFGFTITLPNGSIKKATLAYNIKLSTALGITDTTSADYIFLPGFTSGKPTLENNVTPAGSGFIYKYSTDRYGNISTRYADPHSNDLFNQPLTLDGNKVKVLASQWNLVQQNILINSFKNNEPISNGSITTSYNKSSVTTDSGSATHRILVDEKHAYNLQPLIEIYRHYEHVDYPSKKQLIQIKDIIIAWDDELVEMPEVIEEMPDVSDYDKAIVLNLKALVGMSGSKLMTEIETQLNASKPVGSKGSFKVIPKWGTGDSFSGDHNSISVVLDSNGEYVLRTVIAPTVYGTPSVANSINNGFSFLVKYPTGLVKEATFGYSYKVSEKISTSDSQDYLFLPGLTSGDPLVSNNASPSGAGFTYKFSTDKYGYLNTRFMDATDNGYFNKQLQQDGTGFRILAKSWNLVQQKLITNNFANNLPLDNGSLNMLYNKEEIIAKTEGALNNRIQIDKNHSYHLSALMEVTRHSINGEASNLLKQVIDMKTITFAWNDATITLPVPELPSYPNEMVLDLQELAGITGSNLIRGIENQLNASKPAGTKGDFKVTSTWGADDQYDNLMVIQDGADYVLQTVIEAGVYSLPSDANIVQNGFSFLITLPNGLVQEASLSYSYKMSETISSSASPDYIYLPGLTSGNPLIEDGPTAAGKGFTYKFTTNKYGYLNTRAGDATNGDFYDQQLHKEGKGFKPVATDWNIIKQKFSSNDFIDNVASENGSVKMFHNSEVILAAAGAIENRTQIDETHAYQLSALMEIYRHYKHTADDASALKEQVISIKDITLAWGNTLITLPTGGVKPTTPNDCSIDGSNSRVLDLTGLESLTGQHLLDEITAQLGDATAGDIIFGDNRENLSVVSDGEGGLALQVTYEAGKNTPADTGNGTHFKIPFPVTTTSLRGACFAYDLSIALSTASADNSEIIYLPSIKLNDNVNNTTLVDQRYVANHNKRLGAKFSNFTGFSWLDNSPRYVAFGAWMKIKQETSFTDSGLGKLSFERDGTQYMGDIKGIPYNEVEYQIVPLPQVNDVTFTANFDTYRESKVGVKNQTFLYRNITIGWSPVN